MPITYTSKHHSPEDPGGIIREVLDMGPDFTGPAQDVLLGWTLRLGDTVDPAAAARTLLERYGYADRPAPEGACGELIKLLRETADYPQGRLDTHLCRPEPAHRRRRRGGWKSRREGR
jgi:hypothetical protein